MSLRQHIIHSEFLPKFIKCLRSIRWFHLVLWTLYAFSWQVWEGGTASLSEMMGSRAPEPDFLYLLTQMLHTKEDGRNALVLYLYVYLLFLKHEKAWRNWQRYLVASEGVYRNKTTIWCRWQSNTHLQILVVELCLPFWSVISLQLLSQSHRRAKRAVVTPFLWHRFAIILALWSPSETQPCLVPYCFHFLSVPEKRCLIPSIQDVLCKGSV